MEIKPTDSFSFIYNVNKVNRKQLKESYDWLITINKSEKLEFGFLYKIFYEYKNSLNMYKVILPIKYEENYLFVIDILDIPNIIRATLFDLITENNDIKFIDTKLFNLLKTNFLIRKSIKKLLIENVKSVNKIKYYDLINILYLPIIKTKD